LGFFPSELEFLEDYAVPRIPIFEQVSRGDVRRSAYWLYNLEISVTAVVAVVKARPNVVWDKTTRNVVLGSKTQEGLRRMSWARSRTVEPNFAW